MSISFDYSHGQNKDQTMFTKVYSVIRESQFDLNVQEDLKGSCFLR